jgi:hypothetical protein
MSLLWEDEKRYMVVMPGLSAGVSHCVNVWRHRSDGRYFYCSVSSEPMTSLGTLQERIDHMFSTYCRPLRDSEGRELESDQAGFIAYLAAWEARNQGYGGRSVKIIH